MEGSADVSTITADISDLDKSPNSLSAVTNEETRNLHASRRVKVQGRALALSKLPVAKLDDQIVFTLGLNKATAIDGHHFITRDEARGLVKLHAVGLEVKSGARVVGQLPVDGLSDVDVVSTDGLDASRTIGGDHSGVREGSRDLLDGILLKIQGRGLTLSKGPVGELDNIAVRTNSGDESVAVNGVDGVKDLESRHG